jgi:transketolase
MSDASLRVARESRLSALKMVASAKAAHIGSSLSVIDILSVLYIDVKNENDVVIVSKGHAAAGTYAVLAHAGHLSLELLNDYGTNGSTLGGHVNHSGNSAVRLSTGSLGHGMPYGIGIALAQKKRLEKARTFVVISDGECDEGTTWESALLASQLELNNLIVVIDRNRIQSLAGTEETLKLEPLIDKWLAFNWNVLEVNGHDHVELETAFKESDKPLLIIANTIKGKGVSFMEETVLWHYRPPSEEDLSLAISEINRNYHA